MSSWVTALSDDSVLLQSAWVRRERFAVFGIIAADWAKPHAANLLRISDTLIMSSSWSRTQQGLLEAGFKVIAVDVSELQKAEGAVTCCSLGFIQTHEPERQRAERKAYSRRWCPARKVRST